jgi:hypothetical protein
MSSNGRPGVDLALFQANRRKIDPTVLAPYIGKHIAWNAEGTAVLACGNSYDDLFDTLARQGIPTDQIVHDYVDDPSVSLL